MAAMYMLWLRGLVTQAHLGTAPDWFMAVVNAVYPRFAVEKHRFEAAFFLRHADQIVLRAGLVVVAATALSVALRRWQPLRIRLRRLFAEPVPAAKVRLYAVAVYACVLFVTYDWPVVFSQLHAARDFYRPLALLRWVPFPSPWVSTALCVLLWISCVCVVLRFRSVSFATLAAGLFVLLQGWLYSFEKIDHGFAPLTYVLCLMPLLLHPFSHKTNKSSVSEKRGESKEERPAQGLRPLFSLYSFFFRPTGSNASAWALPLIRLVIGTVYLQAGLEKLLTGGWEWLAPETFRNYLYLHPTAAGLWVARHDWLCVLLPASALVFQLGFISVVFWPKMRWLWLPAGVLFHAGTYLLMDVGGYVNAWVWLYVVFL
jgi:hypothetical protein